jgi:hypothetical protein
MEKPVCKNCRHFSEANIMGMAWCHSPCAVKIDRIKGAVYPLLAPDWAPDAPTRIKATIDKCDKEGWFEKRRQWWVF